MPEGGELGHVYTKQVKLTASGPHLTGCKFDMLGLHGPRILGSVSSLVLGLLAQRWTLGRAGRAVESEEMGAVETGQQHQRFPFRLQGGSGSGELGE